MDQRYKIARQMTTKMDTYSKECRRRGAPPAKMLCAPSLEVVPGLEPPGALSLPPELVADGVKAAARISMGIDSLASVEVS